MFQATVLLDILVHVDVRLASAHRGLREADPADVRPDPADRRQQGNGQSLLSGWVLLLFELPWGKKK